jgi:hypothetical protein
MFGQPKRAKAVAQPGTAEEAAKVTKELGKKYPKMMSDSSWGKPVRTKRTKQVEEQLTDSGLTPEEIKKLKD